MLQKTSGLIAKYIFLIYTFINVFSAEKPPTFPLKSSPNSDEIMPPKPLFWSRRKLLLKYLLYGLRSLDELNSVLFLYMSTLNIEWKKSCVVIFSRRLHSMLRQRSGSSHFLNSRHDWGLQYKSSVSEVANSSGRTAVRDSLKWRCKLKPRYRCN